MLKLCKWAKKNGAVQIKVDGIEILFPPPELQAESHISSDGASHPSALAQNHPWLSEQLDFDVRNTPPATAKPRPAINSESDHPDVYAREVDAWANQRPLGPR